MTTIGTTLITSAILASLAVSAHAQIPVVKNVVLVHGAFADGSGWRGVYTELTRRGYRVTIVQNPLTSLADDVAATTRVPGSTGWSDGAQPGKRVAVVAAPPGRPRAATSNSAGSRPGTRSWACRISC